MKIYVSFISTNQKNSETGFLEGQWPSFTSLGNTGRKNVESIVDHGVLFAFENLLAYPAG